MKPSARSLVLAAAMLVALAPRALALPDITGLWETFDDAGKPSGFVRITHAGNDYTGTIERGLPGEPPKFCDKCSGALKGKPLIGLQIINGAHPGEDAYTGGEILDPFSGNTYRLRLTPSEDGQTLRVRGFIGLSLFGRTQVWHRAS
jgi:uncharacterized protein (DUF2147 family)